MNGLDGVMTLYTLDGREVLKVKLNGNSHQLDVSGLPNGQYIIQYIPGNADSALSLIKVSILH